MNDDIHALERLTNRQFGFIGNLMGLDQRELIVQFQMQLHETGRTGLAGAQIMHPVYTFDVTAEGHYSRLFLGWQLTIEQRLHRFIADGSAPHSRNSPIRMANRPSAQYQPCPASTSASNTPPLSSKSER